MKKLRPGAGGDGSPKVAQESRQKASGSPRRAVKGWAMRLKRYFVWNDPTAAEPKIRLQTRSKALAGLLHTRPRDQMSSLHGVSRETPTLGRSVTSNQQE